MKIRVTLMTENDKHLPPEYSKEDVETIVKAGWIAICKSLQSKSGDDRATVESVEVVEM